MNYRSNFLNEMDTLRQEMNRLFNVVSPVDRQFPLVNLWTDTDNALITAELPGYNSKEIDISVVGNELVLKGKREPIQVKDTDCCHRRERRFGEFSRTIRLPFSVETEKVNAQFKNGVLHITLPRAEIDKPKKISIKTS
jgi:HSP20 family protein